MKVEKTSSIKKDISELLPSCLLSELGDSITSNEDEDTIIPSSESSESYQNVSLFFIYLEII